MKRFCVVIVVSLIAFAFGSPVQAHDLFDANGRPVTTHQHVWRQQSYGQDYRQGHSVNNSLGSITIWSPQTYNGYKAGNNVRFARPSLQITKPEPGANIPTPMNGNRASTTRGNR